MESIGDFDPDWQRPRPIRRALRTDALVAGALFVGTLVSILLYARTGIYKHNADSWLCVTWALVMTVPLAWRRVRPIVATLIISGAFVAGQQLHVPELLFSNIIMFLAFYSIGAWSRHRTAARLSRILVIAAMFIWLFTSLILGADRDASLSTAGALSPYLAYGLISILTNLLYFGAAYFFGEGAYRSARQRTVLGARTVELEKEREHSAAQAVALERVRIARELHDAVAHHVSVMGVQASAARRVLASDPAAATSALTSIESSARSAVDEMRMLLGALREDDAESPVPDDPSLSTSTRGLDQLQTLIDEAGSGGLQVSMFTVGVARAVPSTVGLSAYRIAQEALTNTRKHAGHGARAELRIRYLDDALEIEVSDNGAGSAGSFDGSAKGSGLGQIGMSERVAAVGGSIEVGPKPRGGYLVRARLPLAKAAQPSGSRA